MTPGSLKKYFNVKPGGILPVSLTIKNNSAQDNYLFDESAVGLTETTDLTGKNAKKTYAILSSGGSIPGTDKVRESRAGEYVEEGNPKPDDCAGKYDFRLRLRPSE